MDQESIILAPGFLTTNEFDLTSTISSSLERPSDECTVAFGGTLSRPMNTTRSSQVLVVNLAVSSMNLEMERLLEFFS
jgi:hypothetical protein